MNSIEKHDLEEARGLRDTKFVHDGLTHMVQDVYFANYADEVVVEVRIWTETNRSHLETWNLRELKTRMA